MICLVMGIFCMSLATLYIPVIVFKARKFAVLFSFGSVFFLSRYEHVYYTIIYITYYFSFSMLWGPTNHLKHLTNVERLPFSITYVATLVGTIYYSVWVSISDCFSLLTRCHQSSFTLVNSVFTAFFLCIYCTIKESFCLIKLCVVEKERRLALPLTRTEGLRTYTTTPGKAWRLAPATWLVFFNFRSKVISLQLSLHFYKLVLSSGK